MAVALAACVPVPSGNPLSSRPLATQQAANVEFDQLLTALRQQAGLGPLRHNAQLSQIAKAHAADMTARGYFAHRTPEGVGPMARAVGAGVTGCGIAENIAQGQKTTQAAFEAWRGSAPHRANMLNPTMQSYGLGRDGVHWVMVAYRSC